MEQKQMVVSDRGTVPARRAVQVLQSAPVEQFPLVVTDWHAPHHVVGEPGWVEFWADARLVAALSQFGVVRNINSSSVGDQQYRLDVSLMLNFNQVKAVVDRLSAGTPAQRARFAQTGILPVAAPNGLLLVLGALALLVFFLLLFGTIAAIVA